MKALAWDDEANASDVSLRYMQRLKDELARNGIEVDLVDDATVFINKLQEGNHDLYFTDWVNEQVPKAQDGKKFGSMLLNAIRRVNKDKPIFVISRHTKKIDQMLLDMARPIFLKSKDVSAAWLAYEIIEAVRDLGLMVDRKRVFIIYGHDAKADGTRQAVEDWLKCKGAVPVLLETKRSQHGILPDLMREMQTCAAFIAICTPDDHCEAQLSPGPKWAQPRQNVLFEMGMVFGLARGPQKLTVLQKHVDGRTEEQARLPSDWGGYLTMRFANNVNQIFPDLEDRLKSLGVALT
jgi:predicted nucleotide-binding protein